MNHVAKLAISRKVLDALEREGMAKKRFSELSGISKVYMSQLSNERYFSSIAANVWETLQRWTNSGLNLSEYDWNKQAPAISKKEAQTVYRNCYIYS